MSTRLACVVFDAERPRATARFWSELLGWEVTLDRPHAVEVAAPDPQGAEVSLSFLPARRPKSGKNRMHLDLCSRSLDHQRMQIDRALTLGARRVDVGQGAVPWSVLCDPEGNEFCVLEPREQYVDTGAIAAIVVDTRDPLRLAEFWSIATGWPIVPGGPRYTGIRSATGQGPWLEFSRAAADPENPVDPGRLHVDLIVYPCDDPRMEAARLRAAGASGTAPATGPVLVLADPETNEFRLLPAPSD